MPTDTERLQVLLEGRIRDFERAMARATTRANKTATGIERRFERTNKRVSRSFRNLGSSIGQGIGSSAIGGLAAGGGAFGLGLLAREVVEAADTVTSATNKIRTAFEARGITTDVDEIRSRLVDLAVSTRSEFGATVTQFSRLTRATAQLEAPIEDVFRATEILNKAFQASGATASEARNASIQLSQALASGFLQGDELRSLRENAPVILEELAKSLNTTIGGLKELGAQGKLTTDVLFPAILRGGEAIDRQFAAATATISQGFTNVGTRLVELVGTLSDVSGGGKTAAQRLNALSDEIANLNDIIANTDENKLLAIGKLVGRRLIDNSAIGQLQGRSLGGIELISGPDVSAFQNVVTGFAAKANLAAIEVERLEASLDRFGDSTQAQKVLEQTSAIAENAADAFRVLREDISGASEAILALAKGEATSGQLREAALEIAIAFDNASERFREFSATGASALNAVTSIFTSQFRVLRSEVDNAAAAFERLKKASSGTAQNLVQSAQILASGVSALERTTNPTGVSRGEVGNIIQKQVDRLLTALAVQEELLRRAPTAEAQERIREQIQAVREQLAELGVNIGVIDPSLQKIDSTLGRGFGQTVDAIGNLGSRIERSLSGFARSLASEINTSVRNGFLNLSGGKSLSQGGGIGGGFVDIFGNRTNSITTNIGAGNTLTGNPVTGFHVVSGASGAFFHDVFGMTKAEFNAQQGALRAAELSSQQSTSFSSPSDISFTQLTANQAALRRFADAVSPTGTSSLEGPREVNVDRSINPDVNVRVEGVTERRVIEIFETRFARAAREASAVAALGGY